MAAAAVVVMTQVLIQAVPVAEVVTVHIQQARLQHREIRAVLQVMDFQEVMETFNFVLILVLVAEVLAQLVQMVVITSADQAV
jgi:hypothetical protein